MAHHHRLQVSKHTQTIGLCYRGRFGLGPVASVVKLDDDVVNWEHEVLLDSRPDAAPGEPVTFAADADRAGREWIASLPQLIEKLREEWGLDIDDTRLLHGHNSVVQPVRRGGVQCMLKLTWPHQRTELEARALRAWDGNGAIRLLDARPELGALLLERRDATRSLESVDLLDAAEIAGGLLRRLAIPAPEGFPKLTDLAQEIADSLPARQEALRNPIAADWLDSAQGLARELGARAGNQLVHADLHYGNVLAGEREPWLAIDPKPIAGDPEHAVPELLWRRLDEAADAGGLQRLFDVLVTSGELDSEAARGWAIVRCVDYWLWGLENGLTEDPKRCRRILEVLA
jgi:streptomycin 6-kinase